MTLQEVKTNYKPITKETFKQKKTGYIVKGWTKMYQPQKREGIKRI